MYPLVIEKSPEIALLKTVLQHSLTVLFLKAIFKNVTQNSKMIPQ